VSPSPSPRARLEAVGVVIPVHNEEKNLAVALEALESALSHPALDQVACRVAIVLDACRDGTAGIVTRWRRDRRRTGPLGTPVLVTCRSANVGRARQLGCDALLRTWAGFDPRRIWLATTDADSHVPPDWLAVQLARHEEGFDFWAGRVAVRDWSRRRAGTAREWGWRYDAEVAPIHGANLGVSAQAYLEAGGFPPLRTGEDLALHRAVVAAGGVACYDHLATVFTSARRRARAPLGFAHALSALEPTAEHGAALGSFPRGVALPS
jgi:glycosyltransferase involved in cell wall biosynthesis